MSYREKPTKNSRLIWLYETQGRKCVYCGRAFFDHDLILDYSIDHKVPTSRGGKDDLENVALACSDCNTLKANMTVEEFEKIKGLIATGKMKPNEVGDYYKFLALRKKFEPNAPPLQ